MQEAYYSGKQADHTRKNQLITLPKGTDIVDVVIGEKGPKRNTTTPIKKPPGGQLTQAQKEFNRQVSQKRVYVEHVIRVIKIFRIAKEEFRMRARMYEMVIGCVCGCSMPKIGALAA